MATQYFQGQGRLYCALLDLNDAPVGGFDFLGNVPDFGYSQSVQRTEHRESKTGLGKKDLSFTKELDAKVAFTLEEILNPQLLQYALFGLSTPVQAGTVSGESIVFQPGKSVYLANPNVTTFTSLQKAATPLNTADYTVDLKSGRIDFAQTAQTAGLVAGDTLTAAYTKGVLNSVAAFTKRTANVWLRFDGVNQASDNLSPVLADIYKVNLDPGSDLPLIASGNNISSVKMNGMVQATNYYSETNNVKGQYSNLRFV
jgi:hypothetical protein